MKAGKFEEQVLKALEDISGMLDAPLVLDTFREMEPVKLWGSYYEACKANLGTIQKKAADADYFIELANTCADKEEEYEKMRQAKEQFPNGDVVLQPAPAKKEKKEKKEVPAPVAAKPEPPKKTVKVPEKKAAEKVPDPPKEEPPKQETKKVKTVTKKGEVKKAIAAVEKKPEPEPVKVVVPTKKEAKKTAKVAAKAAAAPKEVAPVKMYKPKTRNRPAPRPKDRFGFKIGTTVSDAVALMNGQHTLAEIAEKIGLQQNLYYVVNRLRDKGHKVTFRESKVTATAAKKKAS